MAYKALGHLILACHSSPISIVIWFISSCPKWPVVLEKSQPDLCVRLLWWSAVMFQEPRLELIAELCQFLLYLIWSPSPVILWPHCIHIIKVPSQSFLQATPILPWLLIKFNIQKNYSFIWRKKKSLLADIWFGKERSRFYSEGRCWDKE